MTDEYDPEPLSRIDPTDAHDHKKLKAHYKQGEEMLEHVYDLIKHLKENPDDEKREDVQEVKAIVMKDYVAHMDSNEVQRAATCTPVPEGATPKKPEPDPEPFTGDLSQMLTNLCFMADNDPDGTQTLKGQVQMMNTMFARAVYKSFNARNMHGEMIGDYFNEAKMELALHIQKQCAETLRVKAAIEYMDSLTDINHPSPLQEIKKRSEFK